MDFNQQYSRGDDRTDSRLHRSKSTFSERADLLSHQALINRIDVSESNYRWNTKTTRFLIPGTQHVLELGRCLFGTNGYNNDVVPRLIPGTGRNDKCGALFIRRVICEREGQEHDIPRTTLDHISHPFDYPKNQASFERELASRDFRYFLCRGDCGNLFDNASRGATEAHACLQASKNQLLSRSGLQKGFAYTATIPKRMFLSKVGVNVENELDGTGKFIDKGKYLCPECY